MTRPRGESERNDAGADAIAEAARTDSGELGTDVAALTVVLRSPSSSRSSSTCAISRPMWFYLDEWDFLANRTAFNLGDLFRAHNEHWVTMPVLVYRALWWIVRPQHATGRTKS